MRRRSRLAAAVGAWIASSAAFGCLHLEGRAKTPDAFEPVAPVPTIVVTPVACRASHPGAAGDAFMAQLALLLRAKTRVLEASLDDTQSRVVCAIVGRTTQDVIGGQSVDDWKTPEALDVIVQDLARRHAASSVLLPIATFGEQCKDDREGCVETPGAVLRAYLVTAGGRIFWKSWRVVLDGQTRSIAEGSSEVLDALPAEFVDAR